MVRPVLAAITTHSLTKGKYIELLARGYSPREVFQALVKGSKMESETLRKEFNFWLVQNGIQGLKPVRPLSKQKK